MKLIDSNKDRLIELCINHKVKELYLFGSALTDRFQDSSDIDMLIQFYPDDLMDYFTYPKVAVQWLNEALCFYQSLCLVDNEVLRNHHLRVAQNVVGNLINKLLL